MRVIKNTTIVLALSSLVFCNVIYHYVYDALTNDGHHHSLYSIIWAPNAYMVFFVWAFKRFIHPLILILSILMTVLGFNLIFFSLNNYSMRIDSYYSPLIIYAVNNTVFIIAFLYVIKFRELFSSLFKNKSEVLSLLSLHLGGAMCSLIASISVLFFTDSSEIVYDFFVANILAFTLFTSYLFLSELFLSETINARIVNFSFLVFASSIVFFVVNNFFHDLSKETFALILMASIISLFIKSGLYVKVIISALVSALFAAMNATLELSIYDSMLFYGVCITTSIILLMRKHEMLIIYSLHKTIDELKRSKLIDPMTKLLNREGFKNVLEKKCKSNVEFFVAYADLDKFKEINDFMGHSAGDLVLKISSARMLFILGENAYAARLGGDEFAFIIHGKKNVALQHCQKLIEKIKQPITIGDNTISIGISIGISSYPYQGTTADGLIDKADMAMYIAKCSHERTPVYFESQQIEQRKSYETFYLQQKLNIDLILNECYAVFQPIHDIDRGNIKSFEALLRHPKLNVSDIIQWAEEYGYMNELFEFMVRRAVELISKSSCQVNINISPSQLIFNGNVIKIFLEKIIIEYTLSPNKLILEITESVPILEQSAFMHSLREIKSLGIEVFLDDFGSGYAFFSTLKLGVFDAIKIDRELVSGIDKSMPSQRLVKSILTYANDAGMQVIAEGVENKDELLVLNRLGVRYIQGYLFSRPIKEDDVLGYIKSQNSMKSLFDIPFFFRNKNALQ